MTEAPPDDPAGVPSDTFLYRRIRPEWYVADGTGGHRASSAAFQDLRGSLSVALGVVLECHNRPPEDVVANFPGYGLYRLSVGFVRGLGLGVIRDPTEDEPWHGSVCGKKTKSIKTQLSNGGEWALRPVEVTEPAGEGPSLIVEAVDERPH